MANRDEDLRNIVQSYELKLSEAQFAITEEAKLSEELNTKRNEYKLKKRKLMSSQSIHTETIKRVEGLV